MGLIWELTSRLTHLYRRGKNTYENNDSGWCNRTNSIYTDVQEHLTEQLLFRKHSKCFFWSDCLLGYLMILF